MLTVGVIRRYQCHKTDATAARHNADSHLLSIRFQPTLDKEGFPIIFLGRKYRKLSHGNGIAVRL
jgi:hypothetical protein